MAVSSRSRFILFLRAGPCLPVKKIVRPFQNRVQG